MWFRRLVETNANHWWPRQCIMLWHFPLFYTDQRRSDILFVNKCQRYLLTPSPSSSPIPVEYIGQVIICGNTENNWKWNIIWTEKYSSWSYIHSVGTNVTHFRSSCLPILKRKKTCKNWDRLFCNNAGKRERIQNCKVTAVMSSIDCKTYPTSIWTY